MARRPAARKTRHRAAPLGRHEHCVLVLQGGGALGAYQAGVYEGFAAAGIVPDWVAGVSIGAVNGALIAGNAPADRVPRLREFWNLVSSGVPFVPPPSFEPVRPLLNRLSAASSVAFGIPGFFVPRIPPPYFAPAGSPGALSFYDTAPLDDTLARLVDWDRLARAETRLSVGAVDVQLGNSVYFDNRDTKLGPDHVRASGALPPGFPPVDVGHAHYWDGGLVSNTPLWYVLDDAPRLDALILQVDLFSARGAFPTTLDHALERAKDIQYSSRTRFNTKRIAELEDMRAALHRLLDKLPPALAADADARALAASCAPSRVSIVHLINRHYAGTSNAKDYEFSRSTVRALWEAGRRDVERSLAHADWKKVSATGPGVRTFDLTR